MFKVGTEYEASNEGVSKIKFSDIDCSEQSRPEICEVLFEIL